MLDYQSTAVWAHGPHDVLEQRNPDLRLTVGQSLCQHLCFMHSAVYGHRGMM